MCVRVRARERACGQARAVCVCVCVCGKVAIFFTLFRFGLLGVDRSPITMQVLVQRFGCFERGAYYYYYFW